MCDSSGVPSVIEFPPALLPIAVKPVLFDLAFDAIAFPDIAQRRHRRK